MNLNQTILTNKKTQPDFRRENFPSAVPFPFSYFSISHIRVGLACMTVLLPLLLSGCSSGPVEINDLSVISGAALDYNAAENEYRITAEVATWLPELSEAAAEFEILEGRGSTLTEAIGQIRTQKGRRDYWSHAQVLLLNREALSVLPEILDYFLFQEDAWLSIDLVVADLPNASDFWKLSPGSSGIRAFDLEEMLSAACGSSSMPRIKAYQAYQILKTNPDALALPQLSAEGTAPCFIAPVSPAGSVSSEFPH